MEKAFAQAEQCWDSKTGTFKLPKDMSMFTQLNAKAVKAVEATDPNKEAIINDYIQTYGLNYQAAESLYKIQRGILKKAKKEGWDNEQVIYEYNRIVASFCDNYQSSRWYGISGVLNSDGEGGDVDGGELYKKCAEYGLSIAQIKNLRKQINDQHNGKLNTNKDLAHEAVQLAAFTECSRDDNSISKKEREIHGYSEKANSGYEHEEISFKGDVDSGRYDDGDFNSDLDAINSYNRMTSDLTRPDDVFNKQAQYNEGVKNNTINRVNEFYSTYGSGDIEKGKNQVKAIIDRNTLGSDYIKKGATKDFETSKKDFYDYLNRGENKNVGT